MHVHHHFDFWHLIASTKEDHFETAPLSIAHMLENHTINHILNLIHKLKSLPINSGYWLQNIYPRYANVQFNYALTTKRCEELLKINTQQICKFLYFWKPFSV